MRTVWKYKLPTTDRFELRIPKGGEILCLQSQDHIPHIWALVDPKEENESISFLTFGTNEKISELDYPNLIYVGTYQLRGGLLVFHVFRINNKL